MGAFLRSLALLVGSFVVLVGLHLPLLHLPYFWDEAGYYVPAAWDTYRAWELVPTSTMPTGHPPLMMVYLAVGWHLWGCSPFVTRVAMVLIAAATVVATYALARRVAEREPATWGALLLAISPMFFAQSTLVYLDLPAALFTTLAVLALITGRIWLYAATASLAVLTKETAVVLLPVAWAWACWQESGSAAPFGPRRVAPALPAQEQLPASKAEAELPRSKEWGQAPPLAWFTQVVPLIPLVIWTFYYHSKTGFWTGNAEYLEYNLYSTLNPVRVLWSLLRRMYEVFVGGFNWLLVLGAVAGFWWGKKMGHRGAGTPGLARCFFWLAGGLIAAYLLMLSVVGGAVLPRYLLPVFPIFFVSCVALIWRLPRGLARGLCALAATCFVAAWFINPPYPFAYENNLAYADFIRLHQDAAHYLETRPASERILTAWPATDELSRPMLGYVRNPQTTVHLEGFTGKDFAKVLPHSFDVLYIYSRKWEPEDNWLASFPPFRRAQERHFGYAPQIRDEALVSRYHLKLLQQFERRGQWARIYQKQELRVGSQKSD